jgi:two-component system, LytTR family, response regulator
MKTLLLDDEPYCIELLAHLLHKHCPGIVVVAHYTEPQAALAFLKENPDTELVFLDVEMPRLNAFDLLNLLHPFNFKIVFTTAYDKYAVKAIKYSALDYLLKPIDIEELKTAVQKARKLPAVRLEQLELLAHHQNGSAAHPERIALSTQSGVDFVSVKEVVFCKSEGSYSEVHIEDGRKLVLSKSLKEVEELLPAADFFRVHHSHLLNLRHVKRYLKGSGGEVVMSNGSQLPVARNKKEEFLGKLGLT